MEQCRTHPGASAERAVPTSDGTEGTWQPKAGRRIERAQGEPAGKEGADVSGCASSTKRPDVSRDRHMLIVPEAKQCSSNKAEPRGTDRLHSPTSPTKDGHDRPVLRVTGQTSRRPVRSRPCCKRHPFPGVPPPPEYLMTVPAQSDHASWSTRVRARLIDQFPTYLGLIIFCVGYLIFIVRLASSGGSTSQLKGPAVAMIIGLGVMLASLGWVAYNRWYIAGRTGQSVGKRLSKIMLIGAETYAPIGPRNAFLRDLVHILDALTLVGYLWPLWDDKRQTFADQVMKTVVIDEAGSHRQ